jgi:hypothetical protein
VNPGLRNFDSLPDLGHRMKARILVFSFIVASAASSHAGSLSYAQCGTYDAYVLIYKTTERFEELGKLRCGEEVEVLSRSGEYSQIRTLDGRLGWVRDTDLSDTPPPPQRDLTFGLTEQTRNVQPNPASNHLTSFLTNEEILGMHTKQPGSDLLLKKIKSSHCAFDTSPGALQKLKAAGLSDKVLLAMLEAPVASDRAEREAPDTVDVRISDGTPIEIELNGDVSSEEAQEGAIVEMSAAEDLVVNGVLVILRGSAARARIMAVKQPGQHGGSGEVVWFMQDIVAVSGDHIPVVFASKQPGKSPTRNFEGYSFFVSEFHKGSPAIKEANRRFRVIVHGDTVLSVSQSHAAGLPALKPKTLAVFKASTQSVALPETAPLSQAIAAPEVKP